MAKLHPWPTSVAASITASIIYIACTLIFVFFPSSGLIFFKNWFHGIDITKIANGTAITFSSFLAGLIEIIIFTAIFALIFVWIYNSCIKHCERKGWIKEEG